MDKTIPKLSKAQRDKLHDASPEVFKKWVLSLPAVNQDLYHPVYKLVRAVLDGIQEHNRFTTDEAGLPELKLLLATLTCNLNLIYEAAQSAKLSDEWINDFIAMSSREINKLDKGEFFSDRQTFERKMPPFNEEVDDRRAQAILANCDAIGRADNPFSAIKNANFILLNNAELFFDLGTFSLLLHALNPQTFPYWDSCFIMYDFGIDLDHDWAEFDFPDIYPFDVFKGYLDNCFIIQCELQEILAKNGTIILTIAANALLNTEEEKFQFKGVHTLDSACRMIEKDIADANNYSPSLLALPTGFVHLDNTSGGIHPDDFVLVTTTSSEAGKDFAASITTRIAQEGIPVEYFICDTNQQSTAMHMVKSKCSRIWQDTGIKEASYLQLQAAITRVEQLSCLPIVFHQCEPRQTLELLRLAAHRLKSDISRIRKGLIVIDDLNALEDMNELSDPGVEKSLLGTLREIVERYQIPILALRSIESSEIIGIDSSDYLDGKRKQIKQDYADLVMSIKFEQAQNADDESCTALARTNVLRTKDNLENEITLVYDSATNNYMDYFEIHDQELADSNLPKKIFIETNPIEINSFIQHAEEVKALVLESLGDLEDVRILAHLYIDCWFEDGIPQQLAKSIEKSCRELHIDRIRIS